MKLVRWLGARRRVTIPAAAAVTAMVAAVVLVPSSTVLAGDQPVPPAGEPGVLIVGGREASQRYEAMAAVYVPYTDGRTIFCGGVLLFQHVVATGAHCVTQDFVPTPYPTKGIVVRTGSNDRTAGQAVGVKEIRPYPGWDWASTPTPVDDLALVFLDRKVDAKPFPLLYPGGSQFTDARLLGWGLTQWPPTAPPALQTMLREVDTQVQPLDVCAFGFAGTGDVCIGTPTAGACYGDSGGPALRASGHHRWAAFGIASREGVDGLCGTTVYTDLRHYAAWILRQVFSPGKGTIDPPLPCACPMPVDGQTDTATVSTTGSAAGSQPAASTGDARSRSIRWTRVVINQ